MFLSKTFRHPARGRRMVITAVTILVGLTVAVTARGSQPESQSAMTPANILVPRPFGTASPAAPQGRPLQDPPQLVSHDGVLKGRLVVERRQVDIAGRKLWTLTYNGQYLPPTLRIRPGDRLELDLENRLGQNTNLHVHGLHVSPIGNSDNIFVHVKSGQTFHYSYQFPKDLAPGTYWYHPHPHPGSAPQVSGGMSGIIIVDGLKKYLPPELRDITEHVIALKDFQVEGDAIKTQGVKIGAPTTRTVNGQLNPAIHIRPGEIQLWRLANIGANIYYKLHLRGARFQVIAKDANPVEEIWPADTLLIPAGARFDVLVRGGPPGRAVLETLPYDSGRAGDRFPRATLATLISDGVPAPDVTLPTDFAPMDDLADADVAARHTVVFSENKAGTEFYINGKVFDPNRVDFQAKLGTVEEWTIRNKSNEDHSFHMHTNDFQVMSVDGRSIRARSFQDVTNVEPWGEIVVRIHFASYPGKTVFHCHILNHEDAGMMGVLRIVG